MKTGNALLGVWMQPPADFEATLNRWYEDEHLSERMLCPGFLGARRYVNLRAGPKYMAFYELDDISAMHSPLYTQQRASPTPLTTEVGERLDVNIRNEYEQILSIGLNPIEPAPYLMAVKMETDAEHDDELNRWYNEEHLAALAGVPGCTGARRYRAVEGGPRYLAVYELTSAEIPSSPEWRTAADTPWTIRMRPHFHNLTSDLGQLIKTVE